MVLERAAVNHSSSLVAIKGRIDYIVNIGGEKVNLLDIEHTICKLNEINEVIVLPLTDELYGVRLLVCLERSIFSSNPTELMLIEQLKQHLLPKKYPISVLLVDKLPRNQHGKLDRKALLLSQKEKIHDH